ncbi:hypothetical protein VTI74DRAFT_7361 [Chaetomium olivicolor]
MSTAKTAIPPATPQPNGYDAMNYHQSATDADRLSNPLDNLQGDYGNHSAAPIATRPAKFTEEWDASQRGSSIVEGPTPGHVQRSTSYSGHAGGVTVEGSTPLTRGNTLKKKASLRRSGSLKRSGSRRSMKAGSVRSLALQSTTDQDEMHSAFYCPVPTAANPTEALANRFQAWRKILKDLITYFREIQTHYEQRAKSLVKLANVLNNIAPPQGFLASNGLDDALQILRSYNKQAVTEASKAREIEEDVILALTGLRSDLHQKIKEIKNLSGDFKNSVDKEMDSTRRAVNQLQEALGQTELDPSLTIGKQDPYLLRIAVDRQLERQIDEENYLHQAYLNLENSGRELESIVVGEIQKAYNAYAGILKRESDVAYNTVEELRSGPISMPKDREWTSFIQRDERFVDPDLPMRSAETIHYPGRDHPACQEIRAGLLERKSKYLKSYTPGWYVLSPTHLHEYKSADKTQAPVMSLYLPEQKLGSHSAEGSSSNKFALKGRQTGSMHRGHTWVFRAESHDTMMAWYDDIKTLTERTPEERNLLMRATSRSVSRTSQRSSVSSDGVDDDEEPPFTATVASVNQQQRPDSMGGRRPSGGRFPSDIQVTAQRGLQAPVSPMSGNSVYGESFNQHDPFTMTAAAQGNDFNQQSQGLRGNELHDFQRATALDGSAGGPVQYSHSITAATPTPQQRHPVGGGGPVWAEPVPIPPPASRQHQQLTSSSCNRNSTESEFYDSQSSVTAAGTVNGRGVEPQQSQSQDGTRTPRLSGDGMLASAGKDEMTAAMRPGGGMVRQESTGGGQMPEHLHVPGEYPDYHPRGANGGL